MRNVIVLDTASKPFLENRIFNQDVARLYPCTMMLVRFHEEAKRRGFEVVTCDQVAVRGIRPQNAILVTEQWSPLTAGLILRGALPGVVMSFETIWHAWPFYSNLSRISRLYRHVFVFDGASKWVNGRFVVHHTTYCPQPRCKVVDHSGLAWKDKQFMVLMNSAYPAPDGSAYRRACRKEPSVANDLYGERLQGVLHFAGRTGFHLYGRGWDRPQPWMPDELCKAVDECYQGECKYENKVATLSNYRFALCFENTRFEGYITEKIFDCFFAGCIPIYCGPPDIDKFVPKEAYIAFDDFKSYEVLEYFLNNLEEEQAKGYLAAAANYLASSQYAPFYQDNVAREILDAIESCVSEGQPARGIRFATDLLVLSAKFAPSAAKARLGSVARRMKGMVGR